MKHFKNDFLEIRWEENGILWDKWSDKTESMGEEDFKEFVQNWRDMIIENKVKTAVVDTTLFGYPIIPDLQNWLDKNITAPTVKAGLKRMAFLVSSDLFAQVSIEQTMDENENPEALLVRYFEDEEKARTWLKA